MFVINPYIYETSWNWLLNNLVSYYKCDTNGSFPDSEWSNDGTINGATYTASGKINWAYDFDGSNDYISLSGLNISWYSAVSFNCWINWDLDTWGIQDVINDRKTWWSGTWFVFYHTWSAWKFWYRTLNNNSTSDEITESDTYIPTWTWTMITCTYDGTTVRLYKNATAGGTNASTWNIGTVNSVELWSNRVLSGRYFNWKLDEIGFWDKALSTDEIDALYNSWAWLSYDSFTS
jgi:hypothetical protein